MKREGLMMLVAGVVLGAVLGFIATRQYYVGKLVQQPPPQVADAQAGAAQSQGQPSSGFDPAQHEAMLAQIKAELAQDPKNVEKRVMLGNIYYDAQKWSEAAPWYEEALKLAPTDSDVMVDLGICYRNESKPDQALALFDKALAVSPGKKQALFNKAVVYGFDLKDKAKADAIVKELQDRYPGDSMVKQLADELAK